ncbi:MAG: NAD-dependent DNA ligase LigA [Spirochaetales bacterium]|nr:NAD-dependent DNA ligase LigA [Spirochaetales bacterium]
MTVKEEIIALRQQIALAQRAYYVDSNSIMSDVEFDVLFDKLSKLESEHPEFYDANSPTAKIGSDIDNELPEREHSVPVLSLDKCYSAEDMLGWIKRTQDKFPSQIELSIEPKIDGSGVVLYYDNGELQYALTRGNGYIGNDITANVKTIRNIPLKISYTGKVAVRGEIYITTKDFEEYNKNYGDNRYANPRNLASGCSRRLKSSEVAECPLRIFVYECFPENQIFSSHLENMIFMKENGLPVNSYFGFFTSQNINEELRDKINRAFPDSTIGNLQNAVEYLLKFSQIRKTLDYDIDGLVIKVNDIALREKLGMTEHHPRWAIAYKFDAPTAQTILKGVTFQVGRGGRITPVALLQPVELAGSVISRATLHNEDYIQMLGINIGDTVNISKRGDVIPAVEEVVEKGENIEPLSFPEKCPSCASILVKDGAHHFCANSECPKKMLGRLQYFAGRSQMNIESLGDKTLEFLFENNMIIQISDIYTFDFWKLLGTEGYGEKKIRNIFQSVEESKKNPFSVVLASLGLKDIGGKAAEILVNNFHSVDKIIEAAQKKNLQFFTDIDGFGETLAQSVIDSFNDEKLLEQIKILKNVGLKFAEDEKNEQETNLFLSGTRWVVTGSFATFKPREKAAELIKKYGGEVLSSVSGKTTHLLCGEEAGSKLEKARSVGANIVDEQTFIKMIEENTASQEKKPDNVKKAEVQLELF